MKKQLARIVITVLLVAVIMEGRGQSSAAEKVKKEILTADSLATGNWKDILTSFFQLSFDRLTSQRKQVNFQSNPFAVLLRANPDANKDINYKKYGFQRNLNFGFGLGLDSNYRFDGFTSGLRYAIINKRDSTVSRWLFEQTGKGNYRAEIVRLIRPLLMRINKEFVSPDDSVKRNELSQQVNNLSNNRATAFNQLDTALQRLIRQVAVDSNLTEISEFINRKPDTYIIWKEDSIVSDLKRQVRNAPLLTLSLSDTTYRDQFVFSNVVLRAEFLKGVGKPKPGTNWELNLQAGVNFVDDTVRRGRDLSRSLFRFEPGINLVVRNQLNEHSWLETELSGLYIHNFGNLYVNEQRDSLFLNLTLRVRIIADIWVPLEIRYDPRSGNVFGFLNVRLNFNGLAARRSAGKL